MRPHKLIGLYKGCWECHVFPDLLLIREQTEEPKDIILNRLGSHSELFWCTVGFRSAAVLNIHASSNPFAATGLPVTDNGLELVEVVNF